MNNIDFLSINLFFNKYLVKSIRKRENSVPPQLRRKLATLTTDVPIDFSMLYER